VGPGTLVRMTDIYVDATVAGMSDAANHLAHLIDTGHGLILVGDCPAAVVDALRGANVAEALPRSVSPGSWHVSADPEICGANPPGLQTLLVGPRLAPSPRPGPRCDAEARDVASAVLEILGREVMG
jgi:putative NIF3 family GTP cyclohydrolase 1 type 2